MAKIESELLEKMRNGEKLTTRQQLTMIATLSLPAILAQLSSVLMEYIDAAMVGQLGAEPSASIGLVAPLTWVFFGVTSASVTGFAVQIAQNIGAKNEKNARNILKNAALFTFLLSLILGSIGVAISAFVPGWLRGEIAIQHDAYLYFVTFMAALPIFLGVMFISAMLRCSGNIKTPSAIHVLICILDVFFNFLLIFDSHTIPISSTVAITIPGAGLGVFGAALGTVCAEICGFCLLLRALFKPTCLLKPVRSEKFHWDKPATLKAAKISLPIAFEHCVMSGALVMITRIIAPLGAVSLSANSLAVSAESICYMPCYGISEAATTIIGQSIGAKRHDLTRRLALMAVFMGIGVMVFMGAFMFAAAPLMFAILTPVAATQALGIKILRIEAFAEPFYGAAIVSTGCLRGAGDTLVPSLMNFVSMWGVRISLSLLLVDTLGLVGVWIAMASELAFRGCLFFIRIFRKDWSKSVIAKNESTQNE